MFLLLSPALEHMTKSPKKAPPNMESRSERKQRRREQRLRRRMSVIRDRKLAQAGYRKDFSLQMLRWLLKRCHRIQIVGDCWRTNLWIFKGKIIAEWRAYQFETSCLTIRGFRGYREKIESPNHIGFRPEDFGIEYPDVNVRQRHR